MSDARLVVNRNGGCSRPQEVYRSQSKQRRCSRPTRPAASTPGPRTRDLMPKVQEQGPFALHKDIASTDELRNFCNGKMYFFENGGRLNASIQGA